MRGCRACRVSAVPLALATLALTGGHRRAAWPAPRRPTSQKVFTQKLLDDAKTSSGVKKMLTDKVAIVDPRSGFVDVTGDGRQDAVILVSTGGAGGRRSRSTSSPPTARPTGDDRRP